MRRRVARFEHGEELEDEDRFNKAMGRAPLASLGSHLAESG